MLLKNAHGYPFFNGITLRTKKKKKKKKTVELSSSIANINLKWRAFVVKTRIAENEQNGQKILSKFYTMIFA